MAKHKDFDGSLMAVDGSGKNRPLFDGSLMAGFTLLANVPQNFNDM